MKGGDIHALLTSALVLQYNDVPEAIPDEDIAVRPSGSPKELEARRRIAGSLLKQGRSLSSIAEMLGCHPSSVMRWRDALEEFGEAGLKARPASGRPPKLKRRQQQRLVRILLRGAMVRGYRTELWTTQRIAEVIEAEVAVRYHRDHVGRLLHRLNWTPQKPDRRALERNEEAIDRWKRKEWPRIKKGLRGWAPTSYSSTNRGSC
jgi:transposase